MSSNPVIRSPRACRSSWSRCTADATSERRGKRCGAGSRRRKELEYRCRHDAQRSFGADEKLLEVVPGVVLAQAAQPIPDATIGEYDLDAEHELARVAEAKDSGAARIRRKVAADRAASFGGQRQRKQQPFVLGRLLDRREGNAGLSGQRRVIGVDGANAIHPRQRQHDRHCPDCPASRRRTVRYCPPARRSAPRTRRRRARLRRLHRYLPGRTTASARPW